MSTSARPMQRVEVGGRINPPAGALGWLPVQFWNWTKQYYAYVTNFLPIAAGGTNTNTIAIQSDSYFAILYATAIMTDTTDLIAQTFMPMLVALSDSAAGQLFQSNPFHANNVFGDAENPGIFAVPYIMQASSTLAVAIQNLDPTNAKNVRIAFHGFRLIPRDQNTGLSTVANG